MLLGLRPLASASMLLFNSDQDYEATIRLLPIAESDSSAEGLGQMRSVNQTCSGITQGQSTFYVNNPEIAPPLADADTVATDIAEATVSVDLLGLGGNRKSLRKSYCQAFLPQQQEKGPPQSHQQTA